MISARSLTKSYRSKVAVSGLTFDVTPGAVTGFLGPNGSGKSTTLRMIVGLDAPTSGSALIGGVPFAELRWPVREVGALLDTKAFHPARSARDHLNYLARLGGISRHRVDEVLDVVGLTSVAGQRTGKYSLGMGQRLGIAGALLGDPGILLFDEPINGLDPEGIRWARHLLRSLAAEGRTVFVSSHLINEMALTAERLVVIGRGKLIAETSVAEFTAQSRSMGAGQSVRVVSPTASALVAAVERAGGTTSIDDDEAVIVAGLTSAQISGIAARASLTIHELTPLRASLEDVFMEITSDALDYRTGGSSESASHQPAPVSAAKEQQ
jgi:ABC-2 type transport system ATP-binding protein